MAFLYFGRLPLPLPSPRRASGSLGERGRSGWGTRRSWIKVSGGWGDVRGVEGIGRGRGAAWRACTPWRAMRGSRRRPRPCGTTWSGLSSADNSCNLDRPEDCSPSPQRRHLANLSSTSYRGAVLIADTSGITSLAAEPPALDLIQATRCLFARGSKRGLYRQFRHLRPRPLVLPGAQSTPSPRH